MARNKRPGKRERKALKAERESMLSHDPNVSYGRSFCEGLELFSVRSGAKRWEHAPGRLAKRKRQLASIGATIRRIDKRTAKEQ